jgi:hypothetical protein
VGSRIHNVQRPTVRRPSRASSPLAYSLPPSVSLFAPMLMRVGVPELRVGWARLTLLLCVKTWTT